MYLSVNSDQGIKAESHQQGYFSKRFILSPLPCKEHSREAAIISKLRDRPPHYNFIAGGLEGEWKQTNHT